jgi:predicted DNA-binding transcriptional regulator AlpA
MQTQNPALADRFVPRSETLHMLGIKSPATLYSMIRDPRAPKALRDHSRSQRLVLCRIAKLDF